MSNDAQSVSELKNIPNILTGFRVLLTPFIYTYIILLQNHEAVFLYLIALFTDILDGYVARRTGTDSPMGAFFDVCADFLLLSSCALGLFVTGLFDPWVLGVIVLMFGQFILGFGDRIVYDPFGKAFGLFSLLSIPVILASPSLVFWAKYCILLLGGGSLIGRRIYLMHNIPPYSHPGGRHLRYLQGLSN